MKISGLNLREGDGVLRVEARIEWEDADRPPLRIFLDSPSRFKASIWPDPNAFALAAILPAWHAGERRLLVEGTLCPVFRDHVRAALGTLSRWYPNDFGPMPHVEAAGGFVARRPSQTSSLSLLSCGIDSLATLRGNQLNLPPNHPGVIRAGLMVAFSKEEELSHDLLIEQSAGRLAAAESIVADTGIDVIPVRTNFWWLDTDGHFYSDKSHGAILGAAASFFSEGFHKAYIASCHEAANLVPWGSHPLLDHYYSSGHFEIRHDGLHLTRSEKVSLVADWPAGLEAIRVCQNDNSGSRNCGTCEKCIRTMTALLILGKLRDCGAFPAQDVSEELLESLDTYDMLQRPDQISWYREFLPGLEAMGRVDLSRVLAGVLAKAGSSGKPGAGSTS